VRSPQSHAKLVSIDTAAAAAMPGVLKVLTGADLEAAGVGHLPSHETTRFHLSAISEYASVSRRADGDDF